MSDSEEISSSRRFARTLHSGSFLPTSQMNKCPFWFHLVNAILGTVLGIFGFFMLGFYMGNMHAGIWSLASSVFALISLTLHLLYKNQNLETCCSGERGLALVYYFAIVGIIIGVAAAAAYLGIAMIYHIPIFPIETSLVVACVQGFITGKWAFFTAIVTNHYRKIVRSGYQEATIQDLARA